MPHFYATVGGASELLQQLAQRPRCSRNNKQHARSFTNARSVQCHEYTICTPGSAIHIRSCTEEWKMNLQQCKFKKINKMRPEGKKKFLKWNPRLMLATTDGQGQPRSANAVKSPQNRKKKKTSPASYFKRFIFFLCRNLVQECYSKIVYNRSQDICSGWQISITNCIFSGYNTNVTTRTRKPHAAVEKANERRTVV